MAAVLGRGRLIRVFSNLSVKFRNRQYSSSNDAEGDVLSGRSNWVTVTDDGEAIVCWHPEPKFPYECSKPFPIMDPKLKEGDSPLKLQYRLEDLSRNRSSGPTIPELQALTSTNKHIWYPKSRKRTRQDSEVRPQDRDGL